MAQRLVDINEKQTGFFNIALIHQGSGEEFRGRLRSSYRNVKHPVRIRLGEPGPYTLNVQGVPYYKGDPMPGVVSISVRQGLYLATPLGTLALIFILIAISYIVNRIVFHERRWKG